MDTNENNNPNDPTPPPIPPAAPFTPPPSTPPPPPYTPPAGAPPPVAPAAIDHPSGISKDERLWASLCHIVPLIIWLIKREGMPFVEDQGKEALNFQISIFIVQFGLAILHFIPFIGCLSMIASMLIFLTAVVLAVMGAIKANEGVKYRYPWSLKLIK
jgi:uncharacterized Tic20 family protein